MLNHRVDKIIVDNNRVHGVVAGDKLFRTRVVVANVNAKTDLLELVGEKYLDKEYVNYIKKSKNVSICIHDFPRSRYGSIKLPDIN